MIAKLIVHGADREHARRRMLRALDEFLIEGPKTLIGFHKALLSHECFVRGETCHGLVESDELAARAAALDGGAAFGAPSDDCTGSAGRAVERVRTVEVDGRRFEVRARRPGAAVGRRSRGAGTSACTPPAAAARDATRSSRRCRGRCSPCRSPTATRSRRAR